MCGVTLDDRDMKYYYAVLTHGITRKLDILLPVSYTHLTLPTKA